MKTTACQAFGPSWTRKTTAILTSKIMLVALVAAGVALYALETGPFLVWVARHHQDLFGYDQGTWVIDRWRIAEADMYRAAPFIVQLPILWVLLTVLGFRTTPRLLAVIVILSAAINHSGIFASDLYERIINISFLVALIAGMWALVGRRRNLLFPSLATVIMAVLLIAMHLFVVIGIDGANRSAVTQDLNHLLSMDTRTMNAECRGGRYACYRYPLPMAEVQKQTQAAKYLNSLHIAFTNHPEWPFASAVLKAKDDVYVIGETRDVAGYRLVLDLAYTAMHMKLEIVMAILVILQTTFILVAAIWLDRVHTRTRRLGDAAH